MSIVSGEAQQQFGCEMLFGSIKSFNTRRGFGFVTCEATAQLYGRDVYLSKDEAMTLAGLSALGSVEAAAEGTSNNEKKTAPVAEGDFLSFYVKLSTEGFPQAVQVGKMRRLTGVVSQPQSSTCDGIIVVTGDGNSHDGNVRNDGDTFGQLLGSHVKLPTSACGQLQLVPDDEVAFCCVMGAQVLEAHGVDLLRTRRVVGSVLGCFTLKLPRIGSKNTNDVDDAASTAASSEDSPYVELQGYALTDRVFVSEMPLDVAVSDLMRLFGKIGGQAGTVTSANDIDTGGSACITFSAVEQVAKFLTQATHTISENGVTQLAQLGPCLHRQCRSSCRACLPQTATNSQVIGVPIVSVETKPEVTPRWEASGTTGVPCAAFPGGSAFSPTVVQDTQLQYAASLSAPTLDVPMMTRSSWPTWRCCHGSIVVPAETPEMMLVGESGSSVHVQWPTVVHASAYFVELVDQSTGLSQRFVRGANTDCLSGLADLRVDGLRPGAFAANVRCVAPCGCESVPSPWAVLPCAWVQPCGMPLASACNVQPISALAHVPVALPQPHPCPPPPCAPPSVLATPGSATAGFPPIAEHAAAALMISSDECLTLD